jgi:hypothetical protein
MFLNFSVTIFLSLINLCRGGTEGNVSQTIGRLAWFSKSATWFFMFFEVKAAQMNGINGVQVLLNLFLLVV